MALWKKIALYIGGALLLVGLGIFIGSRGSALSIALLRGNLDAARADQLAAQSRVSEVEKQLEEAVGVASANAERAGLNEERAERAEARAEEVNKRFKAFAESINEGLAGYERSEKLLGESGILIEGGREKSRLSGQASK